MEVLSLSLQRSWTKEALSTITAYRFEKRWIIVIYEKHIYEKYTYMKNTSMKNALPVYFLSWLNRIWPRAIFPICQNIECCKFGLRLVERNIALVLFLTNCFKVLESLFLKAQKSYTLKSNWWQVLSFRRGWSVSTEVLGMIKVHSGVPHSVLVTSTDLTILRLLNLCFWCWPAIWKQCCGHTYCGGCSTEGRMESSSGSNTAAKRWRYPTLVSLTFVVSLQCVIGMTLLSLVWYPLICTTQLAEIAEARSYFQKTGNVDGALQKFPRHLGSERALVRIPVASGSYRGRFIWCERIGSPIMLLCTYFNEEDKWSHQTDISATTYFLLLSCCFNQLGGLKKNPGNWLMAFNCIPRPMRLMYVERNATQEALEMETGADWSSFCCTFTQ